MLLQYVNFAIRVLITFVILQEEIDKRLAEILGPKTEADNVKPTKKKKEKPAKIEVCCLKFHQVYGRTF